MLKLKTMHQREYRQSLLNLAYEDFFTYIFSGIIWKVISRLCTCSTFLSILSNNFTPLSGKQDDMSEKTAAFFSELKENFKKTDKNTHDEEGLPGATETDGGKGTILSNYFAPLSGIQDDLSEKTAAFFSGLKQNFQNTDKKDQDYDQEEGVKETEGGSIASERNVLVDKIPSESRKMLEDVNSDDLTKG